MRRDHLNAVVSQLLIQRIAVVGAIADQILRLGFDHVEVDDLSLDDKACQEAIYCEHKSEKRTESCLAQGQEHD